MNGLDALQGTRYSEYTEYGLCTLNVLQETDYANDL